MTTVDGDLGYRQVLAALQNHADNPSAFLAVNSGNEFFTALEVDGVIAYRRAGRYLIQFAGPFAAPNDQQRLLHAFQDFARAAGKRVVAIQLLRADAELYASNGFTVNQVGSSYSVQLPEFTLRGTQFMKLRNKISRAKRSGLEIVELPHAECVDDVARINSDWLRGKGKHVKEIEFLVGECGGPAQVERRLFLGRLEGTPVAYISYSPAYGTRPGWLHDLSRRTTAAVPGAMEAINLTAIEAFRAEGTPWLHFGFTPFTGLTPEAEVSSASWLTGWFMRFLADHGDSVYPASSQLTYKEKWAPNLVQPEYLAFQGRASFAAIWQILRVTKSI